MSQRVEFSDEKPPVPKFPIRIWSNNGNRWAGVINVGNEGLVFSPSEVDNISLESLEIIVRKMQKLKEQMKE